MRAIKQIPNYPDYAIDDCGLVYRTTFKNRTCNKVMPPKLVKQWVSRHGYPRVFLHSDGKRVMRFVHRLVLETFVGPCPANCEASHLDGRRDNARLSNLVWETRSANHQRKHIHGTAQRGERCNSSKFTDEMVANIKKDLLNMDSTQREIAKKYGVGEHVVSYIKLGRRWSHVQPMS